MRKKRQRRKEFRKLMIEEEIEILRVVEEKKEEIEEEVNETENKKGLKLHY